LVSLPPVEKTNNLDLEDDKNDLNIYLEKKKVIIDELTEYLEEKGQENK
jgi:hypothetical protein